MNEFEHFIGAVKRGERKIIRLHKDPCLLVKTVKSSPCSLSQFPTYINSNILTFLMCCISKKMRHNLFPVCKYCSRMLNLQVFRSTPSTNEHKLLQVKPAKIIHTLIRRHAQFPFTESTNSLGDDRSEQWFWRQCCLSDCFVRCTKTWRCTVGKHADNIYYI